MRRLSFAAICLLFACSASSEPAQPTQPAPAASEEAAPPLVCDDGKYATAGGTCEAYPAMAIARSPTSIAPARDHHTTMVIETTSGAYLYVVGGTDGWETLHDDVQRAKIGPDGSLGAFEPAGKLPEPRAGHCMIKQNERLYLFGGIVGGTRSGTSETSVVLTLDGEGKVTGSAPGPKLPRSVMHLTCDLAGEFVYVLGGRGRDSRSTTLSARARLGADGTLSPFEAQTALAPDRSHHASFVREKRLYVVGGLTGDPTATATDRKDAVYADIGEDGVLGAWTAAGTLPKSLSVSSAQLYKDAVYIFGGLEDGARFTNKIRRATFLEDGTLSPFATLPPTLPEARGHVHQTPAWKNFLYSVGGKDDAETSLGAIDIARFD